MRVLIAVLMLLSSLLLSRCGQKGSIDGPADGPVVSVALTTADRSQLLQPQAATRFGSSSSEAPLTIEVKDDVSYQTIDGFGASLTDSSAWLIANRMSSSQRDALLQQLFSPTAGIGLSVLRQPMGASDFALETYSYDDTCCDLSDFSIGYEMAYLVPLLKQIRSVNPEVLIMGTPWSAPGWMKTSGSMIKGRLLPQYQDALATYFVKWVQAYEAQGIPIWAVSPQNEPRYEPPGYPGMLMDAGEQASFIASHLGPKLAGAGLTTKILAFDHNWDLTDYAHTVLNDATAKSYLAGTAFHCYGGSVAAQSALHDAHPDRDIWHTECSDGTWIGGGAFGALFDRDMRELVIGSARNWGKGVIKWNLALDTANGPTNGGCTTCFGTVTIDTATGGVTYNAEYYALGHASRFVRRGARRVESNSFPGGLEDVAFRNPDGSIVLVAYNGSGTSATFKVRWTGQSFTYSLPGRAAATFVWSR